ncbi:hypothetical protein ACLI4Y_00185 [Natrialbaceae archaeon A-CW3]
MKAGVLGLVDGTFKVVDSFTETVSEDGHELEQCLTIDRVFSLPGGDMAFEGRAAIDAVVNETVTSIENGDIHVAEQEEIVTRYAEFVGVPGEFVAVSSGDGTFAFDLIGKETATDIERVSLDLDEFFTAHADATPWKAGFFGTGQNGTNGVFHGEDLRDNMDSILADSRLNQIGLSYEFDGGDVKMTATRSGYVEIYQPSSFDSTQYLEYLREEIIPHLE